MAIYIPEWAVNAQTESTWFFAMLPKDSLSYAYMWSMTTVGNIHALTYCVEGVPRPAWYPSWTPDALNCPARGPWGPATRVNALDATGEYVQWTVPASANGCNKIVVSVALHSLGGVLRITKNYGLGGEVLLGTVNTYTVGTTYRSESTIDITGNELATGDTIRFWRNDSATRTVFNGFYAYNSAGTLSAVDTPFAIPTSSTCIYPDTVNEFALGIAPYGLARKWVGGGHSTGTGDDCSEVSPVEAWTKDGAPWTITQGWTDAAEFTLNRTSNVDYDGGPTIVASLDYTYTFGRRKYKIDWEATNSTGSTISLLVVYASIFAAIDTAASASFGGQTLSTNPNDTTNVVFSSKTASDLYLTGSPAGGVYHATFLSQTDPTSRVFCSKAATADRMYWELIAPLGLSGAVWGASWEFEMIFGGEASVGLTPASTDHVVLDRIDWSYDSSPTNGKLTIKEGTTEKFSVNITASGQGSIVFGRPFVGPKGTAVTVVLDSGGGSVTGTLSVFERTEKSIDK